MKKSKKAADILDNLNINLPEASYEESMRTYEAVVSKVNAKEKFKAVYKRKKLAAIAAAAALVFVLSFSAIAAIVTSSMNVSIPDKIAAWFPDGHLKVKYFSEYTLLPKEISKEANGEIISVNALGGRNFSGMEQLEKYLGIEFIKNPDLIPPQYLDTDKNINLTYFEQKNKMMGFISASYQYKDNSKININCNIGFAVDEPQSGSIFYLGLKENTEKTKISGYVSKQNGLDVKISETPDNLQFGIHFVYDDIAYNIDVINSEGIDNETLAKAIVDAFIVE